MDFIKEPFKDEVVIQKWKCIDINACMKQSSINFKKSIIIVEIEADESFFNNNTVNYIRVKKIDEYLINFERGILLQ
jgi:hypothetical protein